MLIDAEKAPNKIQYQLMIKTVTKQREGNILQLIISQSYNNSTFRGEKKESFSFRSGTRQRFLLTL